MNIKNCDIIRLKPSIFDKPTLAPDTFGRLGYHSVFKDRTWIVLNVSPNYIYESIVEVFDCSGQIQDPVFFITNDCEVVDAQPLQEE